LAARGHFDPRLDFQLDRKKFDDKHYFTIWDQTLSLPTLWGIKGKAGFENANGAFLNPLDARPLAGQAFLGFEMPLLQGLFFDEYRLILREAEWHLQMQDLALAQVKNDLLLDAAEVYILWYIAFRQFAAQDQALKLAGNRLRDIRTAFFLGERPMVDTIEVHLNVLTREAALLDANLSLQLASAESGNFLWESGQPLDPSSFFPLGTDLPEEQTEEDVSYWESLTLRDNPNLRLIQLTGNQYLLERRWAREQLKPLLDIQFNALADGWRFEQVLDASSPQFLLENNYKWGIRAMVPILYRKQRGKVQWVENKYKEWEFRVMDQTREWVTKTRQYFASFENLGRQYRNLQAQERQTLALLEAERLTFDAGESSVFLLNAREQKNVEVQVKTLKTLGDWLKAYYQLLWSAGQLHLPARF